MPIVTLIDIVGLPAAMLPPLCWLPQAIKIIREKETRAISLPATVVFCLGIVLWLVYGLAIGNWPLIGANTVTLALMHVVVAASVVVALEAVRRSPSN